MLKALATNPPDRYQTVAALGKDLHDWEEGTLHQGIVTPPMAMMAESKTGKWIALAVGCRCACSWRESYGGYRLLNRPAAPVSPMTVLIADFNNHTGDHGFHRHAGVHAQAGSGRRLLYQRLRPNQGAGAWFESHLRYV